MVNYLSLYAALKLTINTNTMHSFIFKSKATIASTLKHCFDVLEKFTSQQIDRIHSLTFDQVSKTCPTKEIFNCYLKETRLNGSKSGTEQYFDIY